MLQDRHEAGRLLALRLRQFRDHPKAIVLGLPRGGVPVGAEVARALRLPLDVFVVRKLGVPGHEELALGAIASGGVRVLNQEVIQMLRIPERVIDQVADAQVRELERREWAYRRGRPFPELHGATVIVIDDGVATGSTMLAAVEALRRLEPARVVVAAPVMSRTAAAALSRVADACVSVSLPEPFYGVGVWYVDFTQTSDDEVRSLLGEGAPAPRVLEVSHGHSS